MRLVKTIDWNDSSIVLIDQTRLPSVLKMVRCRSVARLITAIRRLEVRGAPALGIAGGYGVSLAAFTTRETDFERFIVRV